MDSAGPGDEQREVDAEVAVSAAALSAHHTDSGFDRWSGDDAGGPVRHREADLREEELGRRERGWVGREADADRREGLLDERERVVGGRERDVDQREIDAELAGWDRDGQALSSERRARVTAQELLVRLGALARELQDIGDVDAVDVAVRAIVAAAVDTVPGATSAGVSVTNRRAVSSVVVTDEVVARVDRAQRDTGEGPALSSLQELRTVRVDDMSTETRWPRFAVRAVQAGVGSMLAVRLFAARDEVGVLSLYSSTAHAFDDDAEQVAVLFAVHAAVAVAGAQHRQDLTTALSARDEIGQAKGILMERYRLSADQAFAVLARASQDTNTKLVDVVRVLTDTGLLTDADRHDLR